MSKTTIKSRLLCQKNTLLERLYAKKGKLTREQIDWIFKKE